jgi:hypothetical protein
MNKTLPLAFALFFVFCTVAQAADRSPDELFPQDSQKGLKQFSDIRSSEARQQSSQGENWLSPALKDKPVTYGDLARLREEIEEIKRRLAAQQNAGQQP